MYIQNELFERLLIMTSLKRQIHIIKGRNIAGFLRDSLHNWLSIQSRFMTP